LNQENNIIEIGIKTAIQFTEGNAVGIGNEYFEISVLPNTDDAPLISLW
jgi:hypothetical protein